MVGKISEGGGFEPGVKERGRELIWLEKASSSKMKPRLPAEWVVLRSSVFFKLLFESN